MLTKVEAIRKALAPYKDNDDVRPRFEPLMSSIDDEHVSARLVTYVELTFHYHRPEPVNHPRKK